MSNECTGCSFDCKEIYNECYQPSNTGSCNRRDVTRALINGHAVNN